MLPANKVTQAWSDEKSKEQNKRILSLLEKSQAQSHGKIAEETVIDYLNNTSMHGLKYVGNRKLHFLERLFWVMAFSLAVLASGYFILNLFEKYWENPVIMSLSPTTYKLGQFPFPAVTICNMNNLRKSKAVNIIKEGTPVQRKLMKDFCASDESSLNDTDTSTWEDIKRFMVDNTQPCKDLLVNCRWGGEVKECPDIFDPIFTDEGLCCTFNMVNRSLIFKNTKEESDFNTTTRNTYDWTPEKGFNDQNYDVVPLRAYGAGSHMGLSVVVDCEIQEYYCSSENSIGFKILLHNPIEMPKISSFGYIVPPARENRLMILPSIMLSEDGISDISAAKRQCFFTGERALRYYRTYSQKNCVRECEANYTLFYCDCVMYYMPKDRLTKICGRSDGKCATEALRKMEMNREKGTLVNGTKRVTQCNCLPSCYEIRFSMVISSSPLTSALDIPVELLKNKSKEYFKDNMSIFHIYFVDAQFTATLRSRLFGFTEFLSNTGGLLGLFMGFSFLSAVEIGYYILIRLVCQFTCQKTRAQSPVDDQPFRIKLKPLYPYTQ